MKQKVLQVLTLTQLRQFLGNSRIIRKFAERNGIVYFGSVHANDESRLVKGHTLSRTQRDEHYCVGTVFGRDVLFLQRSDVLRSANSKQKERYVWNILTLDLSERLVLPHVHISNKQRYGRAFHEAFSIKYRELVEVPEQLLSGYDPLFVQRFQAKTPVIQAAALPLSLTPLIAATLAHHFSSFDFEWHDDLLYIYYLSRQPSLDKLENMLKCGIWLAVEFDKLANQSTEQ